MVLCALGFDDLLFLKLLQYYGFSGVLVVWVLFVLGGFLVVLGFLVNLGLLAV